MKKLRPAESQNCPSDLPTIRASAVIIFPDKADTKQRAVKTYSATVQFCQDQIQT